MYYVLFCTFTIILLMFRRWIVFDLQGSYNPSGSGQDPDSDFDPAAGESGVVVRKKRGPGRKSSKPGKRRGRPKKGAKVAKVKLIFSFALQL